MKTHRNLLAAAGLIAALGLAGCWGASDDAVAPVPTPVPAITEVPDSAAVSTAATYGGRRHVFMFRNLWVRVPGLGTEPACPCQSPHPAAA